MSEKQDDTTYLLSSETNKKQLEEGILQDKQGKYTTKSIDDLWK